MDSVNHSTPPLTAYRPATLERRRAFLCTRLEPCRLPYSWGKKGRGYPRGFVLSN